MKRFLIIICLISQFYIYGDDPGIEEYSIIPAEKEGYQLFVDNCLSCHLAESYKAENPDEEDVIILAEEIDYYIYSPRSGMDFLYFLTFNEIEKISSFLIYGNENEEYR